MDVLTVRSVATIEPTDGASDSWPLLVPDRSSLTEPGEFAAIRRGDARRHRAALLLALAAHVGLGLVFAASWSRSPIGTAGQFLDAISVEVAIVPSVGVKASPVLAPSDDIAPATPQAPAISADAPPPAPVAPAASPAPPPAIEAKPDPAPPDPEAATIDIREAKPVDQPLEPPLEPEKPDPAARRETAKPEQQQPPEPRRAQAKPADQPSIPSPAAPAALPAPAIPAAAAAPSRGAVEAYARLIVAALAETRPRSAPGAGRGSVRIAFTIGDTGGLDSVRVARSSGNAAIDAAALGAVRRARFGAPPPGLSAADRTYEIPYHFR